MKTRILDSCATLGMCILWTFRKVGGSLVTLSGCLKCVTVTNAFAWPLLNRARAEVGETVEVTGRHGGGFL
jgi:hypothetical protein